MKKVKKSFMIAALTIVSVICLTGCPKTGTCESCGQEETLNKYVTSSGTVHWYCDDCYSWAKLLGE